MSYSLWDLFIWDLFIWVIFIGFICLVDYFEGNMRNLHFSFLCFSFLRFHTSYIGIQYT